MPVDPTEENFVVLESTKRRLDEVSQATFDIRVRLLIDAKQTWFQPAIDNFALSSCGSILYCTTTTIADNYETVLVK